MIRNIFWAGDSIVKKNTIETFPQTGIGQVMYLYLQPDVKVYNYAENGRSTKTFIEEGRLDQIDTEIGKQDFLFIQFGHNDENEDITRHTDAYGDYQKNLKQFITTAEKRGAYPVLLTPLYQHLFDSRGLIQDKVHGAYPDAMKELADELNVPCIDLCESSKNLLAKMGDEPSKKWFMHLKPGEYKNYPDGLADNTHLKYEGLW
ncbi:rhamnogalacturonan acetylesterase [Anaerocolumna sedimenticola]|uniref:rhamnogalacturonan acetylesterase n=1 Tax=Anaerocolumna sedimenticola TaxID=2696063 RepID=UPI001FEC3592|nr:rhamnogalacturonan acetylesterase [Anaerocolumna sedimenticola]